MSLERRKPLKRGQPPKRGKPPARGTSELKRTAIRRKPRRTEGAEQAFRQAVKLRAGGICQLATPACPDGMHAGAHAHHVWPSDRDRRVHDPDRGLYSCAAGHEWVHRHPAEARERRWLLRDGDV